MAGRRARSQLVCVRESQGRCVWNCSLGLRIGFAAAALVGVSWSVSVRAAGMGAASPASAGPLSGTTVTYAFRDELLLEPGQHGGARAYVPDAARGRRVPVLVFLHGLNERREMHLWMDGSRDLRRWVDAGPASGSVPLLVVAAPSQTRGASASDGLWRDFDLDGFLDETERALRGLAYLDRDKAIVVGHSGAGCSPSGGLAGVAARPSRVTPWALVAIDTCMDAPRAAALARAPRGTPVFVYWQTATWSRAFGAFRRTFEARRSEVEGSCDTLERLAVSGPDPHDDIVPLALDRALQGRTQPAMEGLCGPSLEAP